jgi:SAM-dependent methyltransferase
MKDEQRDYANPYDRHLGYRSLLLDAGPRFYVRTRHMLHMFPPNPGRILDVGCGDGVFLEMLRNKGYTVDGIDGSSEAIKMCRQRLGDHGGTIECCFIEEYQPERPYDLLLCGEVCEHIEDDQSFMNEMARLASDNAVLILTVPLHMRRWTKDDEYAGHFRRYEIAEIATKLEKAGFTMERYVVWGWPLASWLTPTITGQVTKMMATPDSPNPEETKRLWLKYKPLLRMGKYIFLFDNLFTFTEKGFDVVVRARKTG